VSDEESVELIRRTVEAWNRDDWAAMERDVVPEIAVQAPEGWPEAGTFEGWPAVRAQYERVKESWSDEHLEVIDITAAGDGRFLVHLSWTGHGEASGLEFDLPLWNIYTVVDGKVTRIDFHFDAYEARRAAG
jgi:ketosteroid isomerase-like protein